MKVLTGKDKSKNVFTTYLDLLGVKYTDTYSNKYFNEHPHKYNLFGLSKMLSEFNIENAAIKIEDKNSGLSELEVPFIAHIGSEFVVTNKITPKQVSYIWNGKNVETTPEEFCETWTGITLLAEPDEESTEPDYGKHLLEERTQNLKKIGLFSLCLLLLSFIYANNVAYTGLGSNLLLLFSLVGVYISYLLAQKQMKVQSNYADKICSLFKKSDCNDVLESDASKFLGILSWSEIGLGYFVANTMIALFFPQLISYLALVNICTLPYTIWSVWYQKFKAKQWCPLCLIVQMLLWITFIINLTFGFITQPTLNISDIIISGCLYSIPILAGNLLFSSLSQSENLEQIKQEINSIKATDEVFAALLKKQPHYKVNRETSQILFGNQDAEILVSVLTNPHCNPCAKMHKRIEKVLSENNNNLCVQYIFSSFEENLNSSNQFLTSIYFNNPIERESIINAWFENGKNNKENFFKLHDFNITQEVLNEFEKHEDWIKETGLRATPTILINGYKLPDNYKIEDLKYFEKLDL